MNPTCHPLFLNDGLMSYYYVITAHWGSWTSNEQTGKPEWRVDPAIRYAQLCKHKVRRKLIDTEAVSMVGDLAEIEGLLCSYGFSGKSQTSYVATGWLRMTFIQICLALGLFQNVLDI